MPLPDWCRAYGDALYAADIRTTPEDFQVYEHLAVEFSGDGEHDLVHVEKTGENTDWVARQLAAHAEIEPRDVGYSGLKDRHAITRQWFSVPRWNSPDWNRIDLAGVKIIDVQRHSRKLRRGTHRANRFQIRLRAPIMAPDALCERLERIRAGGVPNYFGEQRFGRNGNNVALANKWASGARLPRQKRGIAISSARSYLFNNYLSDRVQQGDWNAFVPGDVANLDGSGSVFDVATVDEDIVRRCNVFDIHPTGPLFGDGSAAGELEAVEFESWIDALIRGRVKAARRSLRLVPTSFNWEIGDGVLQLDFELGRGAFATAILREFADVSDAHT